MAFKSSFTSQQIENRIKQGYYDDILQAGLDGNVFTDETKPSKQELDLQLAKSGNGQSAQITKEQVESVLTGNITTHRHDTTYNYTEFETDIWDGSSISSSLQGSGTKDDPYLIQSCADWMYLRSQATDLIPKTATSFVVFELKKNLDFGNKPINDTTVKSISILEIDGCGATISNYTGSFGILGIENCNACFFHDINLKNINLKIDVQSISTQSGFIGGMGDILSNAIQNITIHGTVIINGNLEEDKQVIVGTTNYLGYFGANPSQEFDAIGYIRDYTKEHGLHLGLDITVDDQTVKTNETKLLAQISVIIVRVTEEDANVKLEGYDNSFSNVTIRSSDFAFDGDLGICTIVGIQANEGISDSFDETGFYTNSEKSQGVAIYTESNQVKIIDTPTKTTAEMQSDAFVELLNETSDTFKKDGDGETPVLLPKNKTIAYDGYVKQSQFEKFKTEVSQNKEVVYTDINFFQNKYTGASNQRFITEENFIEDLGGVDAVKEMVRMIANDSVIINSCVVIYTIPLLISISSKMYANLTHNNQTEPEDGDSFSFVLLCSVSNGNEPLFLETNCSVTKFNQSGMTVQVNQKKYRLVNSENVMKIKKLTQSEYDGLSSKDSETLYIIVG